MQCSKLPASVSMESAGFFKRPPGDPAPMQFHGFRPVQSDAEPYMEQREESSVRVFGTHI
eukprot:CAMPEP_0198109962 /NCGR_PEP_ID=MMETSP1442-20131203/1982_1 /TAXON_ID= /ORGANISM="Craspedostauros australis, Strain CCMP3328" /LENGTH=59 /DNA_ID=CAMNT_0043765819 /DNA_START=210 /DNA_END=389 /DNA_ORIENTATION=-